MPVRLRTSRRTLLGLAAALALVVCCGTSHVAAAAEPPGGAAPSVDDALLEDLDNELLEGVGDLQKPPKMPDAPQPDDKPGLPDQPLDEASPDEPLEGDAVDWPNPDTDPLGYISREMQLVEQLIADNEKRDGAQQIQDRIVNDLAKLIEQAEQQAQQQSSSQSQNQQQTAKRKSVQQPKAPGKASAGKQSNKPASDSSNRLGRAEAARPDPELLRGLMKEAWGHLPQREREQMMQMSPERFLPQYELLIERYYRRLAEEQSR